MAQITGFKDFLLGRKRPPEHQAPKYIMMVQVDENEDPKRTVRRFILMALDHEQETYRFILHSASTVKGEQQTDAAYDIARKRSLKAAGAKPSETLFLDQAKGQWRTEANPYRHYKRVT